MFNYFNFLFMKKCFLVMTVFLISLSAMSQVEFSRFKLNKDDPMGMYPGRKMLDTKIKVVGDNGLKYVFVDYYIVNVFGDVISGVTSGIKSENEEFIKPKTIECTGPFEAGKSYNVVVRGLITTKLKDVSAFPYQIQIMYMGTNEWIKIPITKENISTFFPKLKWIDVNRYNKLL